MERDERDDRDERARATKRLIWGTFLIALGSVFLLDHLHLVDLPSIWDLWPAIFVVITVSHIAEGRLGSALTSLLLGAWFFACQFRWHGLRYDNSWPLVLIAVGAGIVVRELRGERRRRLWGGFGR